MQIFNAFGYFNKYKQNILTQKTQTYRILYFEKNYLSYWEVIVTIFTLQIKHIENNFFSN